MKVAVTKQKLAINYWMLALAILIIANTLAMTAFMMAHGMETRYIIGLALSFIGLFVYGFQYFWHNSRVLYLKKVKVMVDLSDVRAKTIDQVAPETSNLFVTEEGNLLF